MNGYTQFSWMTEEELIRQVESSDSSTPMERELASRLGALIDHIEEMEEP